MYLFLNIATLPGFARVFLTTIAYIFFRRGSLTSTLGDILNNKNIGDFSDLPIP